MRMGRCGGIVDAEFGRGDAGLHDLVGRHVPALDAKAAERGLQPLQRQAGIKQSAEDHVAGGAGKAVEIQDLQDISPASRKLNQRPSPRITWSRTLIPINSPAATIRSVNATSSGLGAG